MPPPATSTSLPNTFPIEKIPLELLEKIFYHCLPVADEVPDNDGSEAETDASEPESDGLEPFIQPNRKTAPLLLTEVSKGWRKTALNTAELWCSLGVDLHDHRVETNRGIVHPSIAHKMETWLARTGTERGLRISLRICRCVDGEDADRYANEALDVLLRYMHRWEAVELYWGRDTAPNLTSGFVHATDKDASPVPLLEDLQIDSFIDIIDVNNQIEDQLSSLLRTAPRLACFSWFDNMLLRGGFWRPLRLNPTTLQELRLGCVISVEECISMMCNSPQLQVCEFTYVIIDASLVVQPMDLEVPIVPTVLLHLIHLKICSLQDLSSLFDSFTLPALNSLDIEGIDEETSPLPPLFAEREFISLLRRSRCPLDELMLDTDLSPGGLLKIFKLVDDSLRILHLAQNGSGCVTDAVLTSLTRRVDIGGTVKCLCPNLDRICLTGSTTAILSLGVLPSMLESRLEDNNEVHVFIAFRRSHLWPYDIERLQSMDAHHPHVTIQFFD